MRSARRWSARSRPLCSFNRRSSAASTTPRERFDARRHLRPPCRVGPEGVAEPAPQLVLAAGDRRHRHQVDPLGREVGGPRAEHGREVERAEPPAAPGLGEVQEAREGPAAALLDRLLPGRGQRACGLAGGEDDVHLPGADAGAAGALGPGEVGSAPGAPPRAARARGSRARRPRPAPRGRSRRPVGARSRRRGREGLPSPAPTGRGRRGSGPWGRGTSRPGVGTCSPWRDSERAFAASRAWRYVVPDLGAPTWRYTR